MPNNEISITDELRHYFFNGTMVVRLILVNVAVYCTMSLILLLTFLLQTPDTYEWLLNYLMLPAKLGNFIWQPWSLITYMFLHGGFFHILFNMLMLNFFGNIIGDLLGNRRILPLYLLGGLGGALLYLALYQLLPVFRADIDQTYMLGASAAVMAIMGAAATLRPDYTIFLMFIGAVKLKWVALFFVLIDLFTIPQSNPGGHIAHLGGVLVGYLFIKQLQQGSDWSLSINQWLDNLASVFRQTNSPKRNKPQIVRKNEKVIQGNGGFINEPKQNITTRPQRSKAQQEKVDNILDKISQTGYDSLTADEKAFLFNLSNDED